jgi:hypothetical protein
MIVRLTLIIIFRDISNFKCHDKKTMEIGQSNARKSLQTDIDASCKHREFQECKLERQHTAALLVNHYGRIVSKCSRPEFLTILMISETSSSFVQGFKMHFCWNFTGDGASLK